ncbi:orotidine-5'-phosphate decarboxylase [candidate division NPL-UPA2 bacterium]|nr:orotidine-5'-phosphate decarboxylase [candidate division NPL-UPA2 bacterium]
MRLRKDKGIIVAFDMEDARCAVNLAEDLRGAEGNFAIKIGRPLEMQAGIEIVKEIKDAAGLPVIYDGKIADIPYISRKIAEHAYDTGADAVIVHGFVGSDVLTAIRKLDKGDVIAVVEMTHPGSDEFIQLASEQIAAMVERLRIDGVVLPATKPERLRNLARVVKSAYIISPGIKAQGANPGDAIVNGADYEVVGRAIYKTKNPGRAAEKIYNEVIARCH